MWWITGLIISYLIQGCFTQPQDGFLSQGLDPSSGGFRSSGMSPDGSMVSRGGGFDSGFGAASGGQGGGDIGGFSPMGGGAGGFGSFTPGGSGGGSASGGECAMDQRVQGIRCSGQGRDVTDCPSGSTCYRAGGYCCWENISPVEAPCEDPMMQGSTFVQCSPGDQSQTCPGSCHRCQTLGGDMSMGLCCPQITRPGCENSSPMRNAFEEARRRIMGSGSSLTSTSDTSGTRGGDRTTPTRTPDRRFGTVAPPMGFDFGLPSPGGGAMGSQGALCPDRSPPLGRCSATSPCRRDQTCSNIRNGVGGCCSLGTRGMDGMSRFPGGPGGMSPGMTLRMPSCPDGRPSASRCSSGMPCGPGLSCLPVPGGDAVCCPFSPRGMTRAPGIPSMPPGGPGMIGLGMPGVPGMPGAPSMPGAPGMPRMPGMSSMPGMAGRRIPLEMLARRRELMGRDFSRSRSLAPGGRGTRPFGPVISGRDLRGPRF